MTAKQLEDVFDGCALLEYCGNQYVTMGTKDEDGRFEFAAVNGGNKIGLKWELLLTERCKVQY